ncbi:MAG: hypothetical protein M3R51_07160 [Candidatus Eremiobacteraeota bacterium]|nr:hypothetical protein [Candidatus Eremiobacteraeota bacterium]
MKPSPAGNARFAGGFPERAVVIIDKSGIVRYIDVRDIGEKPDSEQIFEELR